MSVQYRSSAAGQTSGQRDHWPVSPHRHGIWRPPRRGETAPIPQKHYNTDWQLLRFKRLISSQLLFISSYNMFYATFSCCFKCISSQKQPQTKPGKTVFLYNLVFISLFLLHSHYCQNSSRMFCNETRCTSCLKHIHLFKRTFTCIISLASLMRELQQTEKRWSAKWQHEAHLSNTGWYL